MAQHAPPKNPHYLAAPPRYYAEDMVGRQTELADLKALILRGGKPIVVSGEGGLGKTTLVGTFCENEAGLFVNIAYITMKPAFIPEKATLVDNELLFLDAFAAPVLLVFIVACFSIGMRNLINL